MAYVSLLPWRRLWRDAAARSSAVAHRFISRRRGRRPRRPENIRIIAALPSVAEKCGLQKPSLVREGGPLAVDE